MDVLTSMYGLNYLLTNSSAAFMFGAGLVIFLSLHHITQMGIFLCSLGTGILACYCHDRIGGKLRKEGLIGFLPCQWQRSITKLASSSITELVDTNQEFRATVTEIVSAIVHPLTPEERADVDLALDPQVGRFLNRNLCSFLSPSLRDLLFRKTQFWLESRRNGFVSKEEPLRREFSETKEDEVIQRLQDFAKNPVYGYLLDTKIAEVSTGMGHIMLQVVFSKVSTRQLRWAQLTSLLCILVLLWRRRWARLLVKKSARASVLTMMIISACISTGLLTSRNARSLVSSFPSNSKFLKIFPKKTTRDRVVGL